MGIITRDADFIFYPAPKKRKVEAVEAESESDSDSGSDKDSVLLSSSEEETSDDEEEGRRLAASLRAADFNIWRLQRARRIFIECLEKLGQPAITQTLTVEDLKKRITVIQSDLRLRAGHNGGNKVREYKEDFVMQERMRDAIEGGFQFDEDGYIDHQGRRVPFQPTEEELEDVDCEEIEDVEW